MHLISPLIAGIRGAENGSVQVTRRGTGQPSTVYQTFEGTDPDSNGIAALDSNGGVELYVDTTATVKVLDSDGNVVREFVAASSAPAIEVRSQSFRGQAYGDGSGIVPAGIGTGQPINLQVMADRWLEVNLAPDWKVGDGDGNETTLPDLIVALLHGSLDVTAPQFGAKGDGLNDDLGAFIAADAEATARGGATLLVPAQSAFYRWSSTFTLGPLNNMIGVSPSSSRIQIDAGAATMLSLSGGAIGRYIEGLSFTAIGAHTGTVIETDGVTAISRCLIGDGVLSQGDLVEGSVGAVTRIVDCRLLLAAATQSVYSQDQVTDNTEVFFTRCRILTPVGVYTGDMFKTWQSAMTDCDLLAPPGVANTGNAFNVFHPEMNGTVRMNGVEVRLGGVSLMTGEPEGEGALVRVKEQFTRVLESSGDYDIFERLVSPQSGGAFLTKSHVPSIRAQSRQNAATAITPVVITEDLQHEIVGFNWTGATGGVVIDLSSSNGLDGARLIITVTNQSGGNIQVTWGANGTGQGSDGNVVNGVTFRVELYSPGGGAGWFQVGKGDTDT